MTASSEVIKRAAALSRRMTELRSKTRLRFSEALEIRECGAELQMAFRDYADAVALERLGDCLIWNGDRLA